MASFSSIRSLVESVASGMNPISGSNRSEGDIRRIVRDHLDKAAEDIGIRIIGFELHGSRLRGDNRPDSDLDVVFEYDDGDDCGDVETREDFVFNEMSRFPLVIDGIKVDFNPINSSETGTLEDYMAKDREYDKAKSTDAEYLAAVKRGDMDECSRMVREAAAKAMPNSLRDDDGLPMVVYRGVDIQDGEKIDYSMPPGYGQYGYGIYFTYSEYMAERYGDVYPCFVQFNRIAEYQDAYDVLTNGVPPIDDGNPDTDPTMFDHHPESIEKMIKAGFDAFIDEGNDGFVLWDAKKGDVKSAEPVTYDDNGNVIPLSKRFDMSNPDIRW